MLSNAYFLGKFRFDTADNEPAKKLQNFPQKRHQFLPSKMTSIFDIENDINLLASSSARPAAALRDMLFPMSSMTESKISGADDPRAISVKFATVSFQTNVFYHSELEKIFLTFSTVF